MKGKVMHTAVGLGLAVVAFAMAVRGTFAAGQFVVPSLPESPYADTEISTNAAMCDVSVTDNRFRLSIELDAETNNCLMVEFGTDSDSNGSLDRHEVDFAVGWDCGEWCWRDRRGGYEDSVAVSSGRRRLDWVCSLDDGKNAKSLAATSAGQVLFGGGASSTFFDPNWNLARIVRRGCGDTSEGVSYKVFVEPLRIILR
jgi:hypothetical protein